MVVRLVEMGQEMWLGVCRQCFGIAAAGDVFAALHDGSRSQTDSVQMDAAGAGLEGAVLLRSTQHQCRALLPAQPPLRSWQHTCFTAPHRCGPGRRSTAASSRSSCAAWAPRATGAASASRSTRACRVRYVAAASALILLLSAPAVGSEGCALCPASHAS